MLVMDKMGKSRRTFSAKRSLESFHLELPLQVTLSSRVLYMFNLKYMIIRHFCVCLRIQNSEKVFL